MQPIPHIFLLLISYQQALLYLLSFLKRTRLKGLDESIKAYTYYEACGTQFEDVEGLPCNLKLSLTTTSFSLGRFFLCNFIDYFANIARHGQLPSVGDSILSARKIIS